MRRDFTVNAMALRLPDLTFVDPYGGLVDLEAGLLRTPSPPEVSFGDDPLRMMRAARFVAQLGFVPAPEVYAAMRDMAASIGIVSAERVREELVKLLLGRHPRAGLELLCASGLAEHVLPELPALQLEVDEHHRHKDVYEHSLTVLEQAIDLEGPADGPAESVPGPDLVLRLAALLHDVGKPATRRFEAGRRGVLPPPRGRRRQAHREAAQGAALRQGDDEGRRAARRAAPALPRVRRGAVDRLRGAALHHGCR